LQAGHLTHLPTSPDLTDSTRSECASERRGT
jgi:hypothetical protein